MRQIQPLHEGGELHTAMYSSACKGCSVDQKANVQKQIDKPPKKKIDNHVEEHRRS